jgi:uncharacterized protein YbjT (DUF2867 family)
MRTALVLGATGLVGAALLERLARDVAYERVIAFTRGPFIVALPKVQVVIVDYDQPDTYRSHLGVDDVFCCLGTTIKKAGSQAAFRHVDLEIPLALAKESLAAGAKQYLIITAVGSDAKSSMFYSRVKGELENELRALSFPSGVRIFRPSLLVGKRGEPRFAEQAADTVMSIFKPLLPVRYRAITDNQVASAMAHVATSGNASQNVYEGADLFAAANA